MSGRDPIDVQHRADTLAATVLLAIGSFPAPAARAALSELVALAKKAEERSDGCRRDRETRPGK